MIRTYRDAREAYKPERVRLLLIAESPPASGGYFYFEKTVGKDHLFRETMKALGLWPEAKTLAKGLDKRPLLRQFQAQGFFLIDTCELPVDKFDDRERREATVRGASRVVSDVKQLNPQKIIIVKATVFEPVKSELERAGFGDRILNQEPLPFPNRGWQKAYREKLRALLE